MIKEGLKLGLKYRIKNELYLSNIELISKNVLFFNRENQVYNKEIIETYGKYWVLGEVPKTNNQIFLNYSNHTIQLNGGDIIYIPPYSIVKWTVIGGNPISWCGVISDELFKLQHPIVPSILREYSLVNFKSLDNIMELLKKFHKKNCSSFTNNYYSPLACKIKKEIESNYLNSSSLSQLSTQLNISRATFCSTFKKYFYMKPLEYKNLLRVFEGLGYINKGYSITDSVYEAGFEDHGQFIDHFKNYLGVSPKEYLPSQMLKNI